MCSHLVVGGNLNKKMEMEERKIFIIKMMMVCIILIERENIESDSNAASARATLAFVMRLNSRKKNNCRKISLPDDLLRNLYVELN
jgi:hypothetical protein